MSATGLEPALVESVISVLKQYANIEQVKLYGSRAKGTFGERSDIDLVAYGKAISRFTIADIRMEIDDLDIPYQVDLQSYNDLQNRELIEHIDRGGIVLYDREHTMPSDAQATFDYRLLNLIETRPELSQRALAVELELSLGKVNHCLKALLANGLVKVDKSCRSDNKAGYAYRLTAKGIREKARLTQRTFQPVEVRCKALQMEVAHLNQEWHRAVEKNGISAQVLHKIEASVHRLIAVYAFGSAISGKMHPGSDLDLAVLAVLPLETERLWNLAAEIAVLIARDVDLLDLRQASAVMRMQIINTGVRLMCPEQAACERFEDFAFSDYARLNEERAGILQDIKQRGTVYG